MEEPRPRKCSLCKNRYARQQEWKEKFEKTHCLTCCVFIRYLSNLENALNQLAEAKQIRGKRVRIYIENEQPEDKFLKAIGLQRPMVEEDKVWNCKVGMAHEVGCPHQERK